MRSEDNMTRKEIEPITDIALLAKIDAIRSFSEGRSGIWCPLCGRVADRWTSQQVAGHAKRCEVARPLTAENTAWLLHSSTIADWNETHAAYALLAMAAYNATNDRAKDMLRRAADRLYATR